MRGLGEAADYDTWAVLADTAPGIVLNELGRRGVYMATGRMAKAARYGRGRLRNEPVVDSRGIRGEETHPP
ncbi:hypothetical protein Sros01_71860 [Streptomyces roseochromogenus]|nr:hypothetical protein Sros01_71860 [Streptomyces roseochromogenus]